MCLYVGDICAKFEKKKWIVHHFQGNYLNSEGQSLYMRQYLKSHEWTSCWEKKIERSNSSQRRSARKFQNIKQYKSSALCFCIHNQWCKYRFAKENIFLYNTFSVSTDSRTLSNRHLEEGWKRIFWNTLHILYWFDTCFQGCSERCSQK